jgi:hypothetical protein
MGRGFVEEEEVTVPSIQSADLRLGFSSPLPRLPQVRKYVHEMFKPVGANDFIAVPRKIRLGAGALEKKQKHALTQTETESWCDPSYHSCSKRSDWK